MKKVWIIISFIALVGIVMAVVISRQPVPAESIVQPMPVFDESSQPLVNEMEVLPEVPPQVPGPEPTPTPAPATPAQKTVPAIQTSVKEFIVSGNNFAFSPSAMTVKKGDTVTIIFKNTGGFHDLVIDEFNVATQKIGDGKEEIVTFVADKTGSFEYYCSVGKHREMGMKGILTVE